MVKKGEGTTAWLSSIASDFSFQLNFFEWYVGTSFVLYRADQAGGKWKNGGKTGCENKHLIE